MIKLVRKLKNIITGIVRIENRIERIQEAIGRIETRQIKQNLQKEINNSEFKVFSQWGEDGIIQYLISQVPLDRKIFIEFGVENYTESNTRFLLINNNWSGLVIDGSAENIDYVKKDPIYWQYNLKAENAFITKENINEIFIKNGITGDIGLVSIDIDGNDYWVWDAINVISPRIVICEYNSLFGPKAKITVPYKPEFYRTSEHYSNLFFGASISALSLLAKNKGYVLVGSNSSANDLFFVRKDLISATNIKTYSPEEAYCKIQARQSRDKSGDLNYLNFDDQITEIRDMDVYDIEKGCLIKISEIEA